MKDKIQNVLIELEKKHECRILFAVESGSRAWGFASPDSDYDVRAVYVKPLEWYLQIENPSTDTFTEILPDDLDVVAWDIRKFLTHFIKSNASIMEWIGSPIVYCSIGLLDELASLKDAVVNAQSVAFHYASMYRHAMADRSEDGAISVKKLCYALRANLCVRWCIERGTMPPTSFRDVCAGLEFLDSAHMAIEQLLALKERSTEGERIQPSQNMLDLLEDRYDSLSSVQWPQRNHDVHTIRTKLDRLFYTTVCS